MAKDNLNENSYPDGRASSTGLQYGERYSVPGGKDKQPSRWMRRKKEFKLRIDGIRNINAQPAEETQGDGELPARKQILEMFDKMLESRLESCQRVNELIREVNRRKVAGTGYVLYIIENQLSFLPMAHRYTSLPNPASGLQTTSTQHDREVEMQAAFDYSDDEDEEHNATETHPLNPISTSHSSTQTPPSVPALGTYNFEAVDYDYPPPGSPPAPSATALPNEFGNSNGQIPDFRPVERGPHRMWFQRAVTAVLPSSVLSKIGLTPQRPTGPIGGGTNNDGVFANVTAKPTAPVRVQQGDDSYLVPEDARQEAPPSYASAQADAVPPYWETTVHAPFSPDSIGEMVIDSLPTGSLFSFCWNLLVSVSFQFIGFLLTYLLHTSHAARLGSRAGLGVTLIQYGFALRSRLDSNDSSGGMQDWSDWESDSKSGSEGHGMHHHFGNASWNTPAGNITEEQATIMVSDATTEWLSFFLMTVGWFVLLTSILGFWRVKRWERGIIASRETVSAPPHRTNHGILGGPFGLRGLTTVDLYQGFGFGRRRDDDATTSAVVRAEEGDADPHSEETHPMIPLDPNGDPQRNRAIIRAFASERRLQRDLTEAGLL
ncbi:hypothetical protein BDN70DRAFT_897297 [Pholiota conissans]|uniref:Metal homeostatis protein bsd2 n=1 Tax=Pholiota conissans TaxID=109636 RepID=A0A9P5YWM3_9AGAR|nr:hypothetical protein BDN70DRAFT_897297 [Pholiota conissans]